MPFHNSAVKQAHTISPFESTYFITYFNANHTQAKTCVVFAHLERTPIPVRNNNRLQGGGVDPPLPPQFFQKSGGGGVIQGEFPRVYQMGLGFRV